MKLDRVNQHRALGAGTALSGVLTLAILANPVTDAFAVALLFAGAGYSVATHLLAGWARGEESRLSQKANTQQRYWESERAKLKVQLKSIESERQAIAAKVADIEERKGDYQTELKQAFDAEVERAIELLGHEASARVEQLKSEYQAKYRNADQRATKRILAARQKYEGKEAALLAEVEELTIELSRHKEFVVDHDAYLKAEFDKVLGDTDALLAGEIKGVQIAKQQALAEIQERDLIIERLKGLVEANNAPKKFRGSSADDITANKVIDILLTAGIKVNGDNWDRKYHQLILWVESAGAVTLEIESQLENIQVALGLYSRPTVAIDRGLYKLTLDTDAKAETKTVPTTPLSRVETTVDNANHLRIVGPSGSGKSTWLDNVIHMGMLLWPTAGNRILDPKYPFTEWSNLTPDFKNDECIAAVSAIGEQMRERFKIANEIADKHGNESPEFKRFLTNLSYELFVIDEAQNLYQRAKSSDRRLGNKKNELANGVRDSLLECLNVGRALNVKGYFITQSAKCSKIGLNEDDFDNCVSVFLGASINYALNKELKDNYSPQKLAKVEAEYRRRKAAGQQYLGLVSDMERDDLYLFELPRPGYYHERVLHSQTVLAPVEVAAVEAAKTISEQGFEACAANGVEVEAAPISTTTAPPKVDLEVLLKSGTHCPDCGTHTASYKKRTPNGKGNVSAVCKNKDCSRKSFQWKVI